MQFWANKLSLKKMSINQVNLNKEVSKTHQVLVEACPECSSKNLVHDYDTGETICGDCGLVCYEQMLDKGPEWRAFTQQEKALSLIHISEPTRQAENLVCRL